MIESIEIGKRLALTLAKKPELEQKIINEVGISTHTLKRYIKGDSPRMPFMQICQICKICEVSIEWLAFGEQEK